MCNFIQEISAFFKENASIIIPASVTLLGFIVNVIIMVVQLKNSKKEIIINRRSEVYLKCYSVADELLQDRFLIYDKAYDSKLRFLQAEMKLYASNTVLKHYKTIRKFVFDSYSKYQDYCNENDPQLNPLNYRPSYNDVTGEEGELPLFTEDDIFCFEKRERAFKQDNLPSVDDIKKLLTGLLNAMRNDIGYEDIEDSILK